MGGRQPAGAVRHAPAVCSTQTLSRQFVSHPLCSTTCARYQPFTPTDGGAVAAQTADASSAPRAASCPASRVITADHTSSSSAIARHCRLTQAQPTSVGASCGCKNPRRMWG